MSLGNPFRPTGQVGSRDHEGDAPAVVDALAPRTVAPGTVIIAQGDAGDHFYVVDAGQCEVFVRGDWPKSEDCPYPLTNPENFQTLKTDLHLNMRGGIKGSALAYQRAVDCSGEELGSHHL